MDRRNPSSFGKAGMEAQSRNRSEDPDNRAGWVRGLASFRRFVSLLLVIALFLLVGLLLLKDNLNDQIRHSVEKQLVEILRDTDVSVSLEEAEYKRGRGLRLRGLRLFEGKQPLLSIDSLLAHSKAEIWELAQGKLQVEAIDLRGVRLEARQNRDEEFNLVRIAQLLNLPTGKKMGTIPAIHVSDCRVRCQLSGETRPLTLDLEQVNLVHPKASDRLAASARVSSDFCKTVGISAEYSISRQEWRVWGKAEKVRVTPDVFGHLPEKLQQDALPLQALQARVDFDFDVSGDSRGDTVPRFYLVGNLNEGQVADERLPFPVTGLEADFSADNNGIRFENVVAESALGRMHLNFTSGGLTTESPFELVARIDPLFLDQRLASRLPPEAAQFLRKYSPVGNIRLHSRLSFQNGRWVPDVVVDLLDVSFAFHKFPYPLTGATGRITLGEKELEIDIQALASGKKIKLAGKFLNPGPMAHGELRLELDGRIPVDAKVLAAMEKMPNLSNLTRKFHPRGFFGFRGLFQRVKQPDGRIEEKFRHQLSVEEGEIKYDLVPIPFHSLYGSIVITELGTRFQGFRGLNVNSESFAEGTWDPVNGLRLTIDSYDLELNDSLKSALPPAAIRFWNDLRPSGTLEAVRSSIHAIPGRPIDFDFQLRQREGRNSVSVHPVWFPYEMKNVSAQISFQPNQFQIRSFKGQHRKSTLTLEGQGEYGPEGWECHLQRMMFDRLVPDREFTSALPVSLGSTLDSFRVSGTINVGGRISFRSQAMGRESGQTKYGPIETSWDLTADIDQGFFRCGVDFEDIYGAVRLTGFAKGEEFESLGGIDIDSLVWNELQFRKIRSPIYVDNHVALLGLWATSRKPDAQPQPLTAVLFGGRLAGNAQFSLHGNQPFEIQATLNAGDLEEFTFEMAPSYTDIQGRGFGGIRINGDNSGTHSLRGEGQVRLVDAKISEVPVMLSMLKLLSVNQIDRTLFNESHADFRIKGEHLFFDNLEFLGDAISIKGNGEMNFDQNLDLQFYTAVGRDGFRIPVISPLMGMASQQILVIDVKGTTQQPVVEKNFFKMLNGKLKENLEDLEDSIDRGGDRLIEAAERPLQKWFR